MCADIKRLFNGPVILNEKQDSVSAERALASGQADAVAFGKAYIANPDLVTRLQTGESLNEWDSATFYTGGAKGYIDYPCLAHMMAMESCA